MPSIADDTNDFTGRTGPVPALDQAAPSTGIGHTLGLIGWAFATGIAAAADWEHRPTRSMSNDEQVERLRRYYFGD